jgi:uncharacterized membrane protein (DUF485 family)
MSHGPAADWGTDKSTGIKTRLGIRMFIIYAFVYAGFVILNTLDPAIMETVILGQSLSIIYGFGLIVFAVILALIYNAICAKAEAEVTEANEEVQS